MILDGCFDFETGFFEIKEGVLVDCSRDATDVLIPNGVVAIGARAFFACSSLKSITIPNSVTSIGAAAFRYCRSLTTIIIPYGVTSIECYAFEGCNNLTRIIIPNSVKNIGKKAFYNCTNLSSVIIPDSVTCIGDEAFRYCDSLTKIIYLGLEKDWKKINIEGVYNRHRFSLMNIEFKNKEESKLIYCKVKFINNLEGKSYYYLTNDASIQVGDIAIVSVGDEQEEKAVKIETVEVYSNEDKYPYPPEKTKYILRKFDKTEDLTKLQTLVKEKIKTPYGEGIITEVKEQYDGYAIVATLTFPWGGIGVRTFNYSEFCLTCSLLSGKKFPHLFLSQIKKHPIQNKAAEYSDNYEYENIEDDSMRYMEEEEFESRKMDMGYLED